MSLTGFLAADATDDVVVIPGVAHIKERRVWLTAGAKQIEGRVWRHADVVREAKLHQWDRENAA